MNKPFYKAFSEVCKSQRLLINYEYMKSVLDSWTISQTLEIPVNVL